MTKYKVLISETGSRELRELEEAQRNRIKDRLRELAKDPFSTSHRMDLKKLAGTKRTYYRLRVGEYRVIYFIDGNTIKVVRIAHRSAVYSWLD